MCDGRAFGVIARRYELMDELGRGAVGVVYAARDRTTGGTVALKVMRPGSCGDSALTADTLAHEHILATHARGADGGVEYVVTEWLDGRDLATHCRPEALLPFRVTLSIITRVADALAYAHAQGCVHGDVKPSNILYAPREDRVRLADFSGGGRGIPLRGTPGYMAPEQVCGSFDERCDQFSLGVTLYHLSCGVLPFAASSLPRLFKAIVHEAHCDVREHDARLPAALAGVLDRLLAKTPSERFPDMAAAATALRRVDARGQA